MSEPVSNGRIALLNAGQAELLDAEQAEYNAGPKCGQCRHWRKQPVPRAPGGALDLSVPVVGECRYQLQSAGVLRNGPHGPELLGFVSAYPGGIQAEFPACSHFAEKQPILTPRESIHA